MSVLHFIATLTPAWSQRSPSAPSELWFSLLKRHFAASLDASTVFLDAAVYFSLSVSFAGILFNYRGKPMLYDDKLGQTSTLLAVNSPITIYLLIYHQDEFDRPVLRSVLVGLAALMTFILQFLFRSASSFNDLNTSSCIDWSDDLERPFTVLFIVKAVWVGLIALFFATHFIPVSFPIWRSEPKEPLTVPQSQRRANGNGKKRALLPLGTLTIGIANLG